MCAAASRARGATAVRAMHMHDRLIIDGSQVVALAPEGASAHMGLSAFLRHLAPPLPSSCNLMLPNGVRAIFARGSMLVVVHEQSPCVRQVSVISKNSPAPYGAEATYETRLLSFPPVITLTVFAKSPHVKNSGYLITRRNEVFFAIESMLEAEDSLHDRGYLRMPAMLNVSRYWNKNEEPEPAPDALPGLDRDSIARPGKAIAWLCTQAWAQRARINGIADESARFVAAIHGLVRYQHESSWNFSSERSPQAQASGEICSWYTEHVRRDVDRRISTFARWEAATRKYPSFIMDVPFIPCPFSINEIAERILGMYQITPSAPESSSDLARMVFHESESNLSAVDATAEGSPYPYELF